MTSVPGINLLATALTVIAPQVPVQLLRWNNRVLNEVGTYESSFGAPVNIEASVQPVPRSVYKRLGLDFSKNHFQFMCVADVADLGRDRAGDNFIYEGDRYEVVTEMDWFDYDGWTNVIAVQIPDPVDDGQ